MPLRDPEARRERAKERYRNETPEQRQKRKEQAKRYYSKNSGAIKEAAVEWQRNNPERWREIVRRSKLRSFYKITQEDFDAMRFLQGDRCRICRDAFDKTPHIDHDHESGIVRGLLCSLCNTAIGKLRDSSAVVLRAAEYLHFHGK
jgi:hypothetical protein